MSGTTSVPTIEFTDNGAVAPSESAIVTGLNADWSAAFGNTLSTQPGTAQGTLISSEAAIIGDANDQELFVFNNIDPSYASGRYQDAICRIYFLERIPGEPTVLQIACGGLQGVVIGLGATIQDQSGNLYTCTTAGTIPVSGTITLPFACVTIGPTAVPASSGVAIYQSVPNWNTVTVSSGVVGQAVESRSQFEARRADSVAANGAGFLPTIAGTLAQVPGVIDYYVTENFTGSSVITGGISIAAHSLYVCVAGGTSAAVARAIWSKKNPGCAYTGNTTVTVEDTNSGYSPPYPSYSVTFEIPTAEPTAFTVTLLDNPGIPNNATALISQALNNAFTGQDRGVRARIGSVIASARYYAGIASLGAWAQIISVQIGNGTIPAAVFTGSIAGTTLTVSAVADATFTGTGSGTTLTATAVTGIIYPGYALSGTGVPAGTTIVQQLTGAPGGAGNYQTSVATTSSSDALTAVGKIGVGQFVYGSGMQAGSLITALGSGTGGTGTYTLAVNQTISSEAMFSVSPTYNAIQMPINQIPTFASGAPSYSPADVNVILQSGVV